MKRKQTQGFRLLIGTLALVLIVSLVFSLAACSSSTPSTTAAAPKTTAAATPPPQSSSAAPVSSAPAPASSAPVPASAAPAPASSAPVSSAAANAITLRMAPGGDNPPPALGYTQGVNDFANKIQELTKGRVKVQVYWSQTLVPQNGLVQAIQSGTADLAQLVPHVEQGKIPLAMVAQLPGIGTDLWARNSAYYDLCNQDPEKSEFAKYNMKTIFTMGASETYIISKNPIRTLADLKGKKVAASGIPAQVVTALGAVPVSLGPPDQYSQVEKGTLDAIAAPYSAVNDFKFFEVAKYYTLIPCGPRSIPVCMNTDTWNKLPADIQKIFTDSAPDFIKASTEAYVTDSDPAAIKAMQDKKVEFITLNASDLDAVNKILAAQADQWAAGLGDAGKKILNDYRTLVDKYEKISPYKK